MRKQTLALIAAAILVFTQGALGADRVYSYWWEAGRASRADVSESLIRMSAATCGATIHQLTVDKGWLSIQYFVNYSGPGARCLYSWMSELRHCQDCP